MNIFLIKTRNLNDYKKALINIGYTIENLAKLFDENLSKQIYEDLSDQQKKNQTFLAKFFCNNLGKYNVIYGKCYCHIGIFRNHCQTYLIDYIGKNVIIAYRVIFSILFFILMIMISINLVQRLKDSNYSSCFNTICAILLTPKNLVSLNLIILTFSKFVYMIIDPYCQFKKISYEFDRALNEIKFSSLISIYLILFIVLVGLNTNLSRGRGKINKKYYIFVYRLIKIVVCIILFIIYPLQIPLSVAMAKNTFNFGAMNILLYITVFFAVCLMCFTFWMIFYLRKRLFNNYIIRKENLRKNLFKIKKIDEVFFDNENSFSEREHLNTVNKNLIEAKEVIHKNKNEIKFLKNMIKSNLIKEVDKAINKEDLNYDMDNYELIDFENEMLILDLYNKKIEENSQIVIKNSNNLEENKLIKSKTNEEIFEDDFSLNENDLKIVNDIFGFSFLYMIVTIEFILYNLISRYPDYLIDYRTMLTIFCICELVDAQYTIIIYFVFFKNIMVQEYKNLKFIGELGTLTIRNNNKGHKIYLNYDNLKNSSIFYRYNDFINFYDIKDKK